MPLPPAAAGCEHGPRSGFVYCPVCGQRLPVEQRRRGLLELLLAPFELVSRIYTPTSWTPDLDVTFNLEALRSGDPERMRAALGFLEKLATAARRIRSDIEKLLDHPDRDIALRARDVVAAMDALAR